MSFDIVIIGGGGSSTNASDIVTDSTHQFVTSAQKTAWDSKPSNILYVAKNGNDSNPGSQSYPFLTIQAAINAATTDTAICVLAGTYNENIVMRDLDGISISGSAEQNTILCNTGNSHTFSWIPAAIAGASVHKFSMSGMDIQNTDTTGTYHALHIDANNVVYPNTFCDEEFDIWSVDVEGSQVIGNTSAYFRNAGQVYWTHGRCTGGDLTVTNCASFITRQLEIGTLVAPMSFNADYNGANPTCGIGRSNITIAQQSVVYGNLVLTNHPLFQMDNSSLVVGNVIGTSLTSYYSSGRDYCPILVLRGDFGLVGGSGGAITLTFPDPQTSGSAFNFVDLSDAAIHGNVALTKTNFLPANARGYAIITTGGTDFHTGTITTNGYVNLGLGNSQYVNTSLTVGVGGIVTTGPNAGSTIISSRSAMTADSNVILKCNSSSPIVITVNADAVTGWSDFESLIIVQYGSGASTFSSGGGVTFRGSAPTPGQYVTTKIRRIGTNEWLYW